MDEIIQRVNTEAVVLTKAMLALVALKSMNSRKHFSTRLFVVSAIKSVEVVLSL